ncbi:uncharacterized protein LOC125762303 [Anopheles funestus]|uniref:uncharacterized protein LOC125762303 n=1 Tax=Anopheles funestus TaxID=62324 RepID=UPI0020C61B62|nr:uncharacterized protein LOC125762303 [Anopheles funestus]
MGIRHLQTFMVRRVENGTYTVQMDREIRNAIKSPKPPLVVINLMAMRGLLNSDKRGLLCGSQIRRVERMADMLFGRLTDAGAELVFFYNVKRLPNNWESLATHQNEQYDRMIDILDLINARVPLEKVAETCEHTILSNSCIKLRRIAKQHGKTFITTDMECDQAAAIYATQHNALAVITHDTDFLIFAGTWQFWHANHINLTTLEVQAFNKQALLRTLGLDWQQMAIWATLAGNDFFKYDELEPFLNDLAPHHQKFYKLAEYVRKLPTKKKLDAGTVHSILGRVYKNRSIPTEAFEWFQQSVAFYQIDTPNAVCVPTAKDPFSYLLQMEQFFVHTVLTGAPFNCTLLFFDYRSTEFGNYFEIIEPMIARIGGILLYHHRQERQHITVAVKRNHREPHSFVTVPVIFPTTITPPPVKDLMSKETNLSTTLLQRKLQLLRWVCSDDLTELEELSSIPPSLLLTLLVLYRLRQYGAINMFEVNLLLLIAHQVTMDLFDPAKEPYPHILNSRVCRLGFLFQKVYNQFLRVAKALGLPEEYRPSAPYDGLRFHNYYRLWTSKHIMQHHIEIIADWRFNKQT